MPLIEPGDSITKLQTEDEMTDTELLSKVLVKHQLDGIKLRRNDSETDIEFAARFIDTAADLMLTSTEDVSYTDFCRELESTRAASEWRSRELLR